MALKLTGALCAAALALSACASPDVANVRPIVDTNDRVAYEADLADCQQLAATEMREYSRREARIGFASVAIGALIGLAIGADIGDTGAAIAGAGIGATLGAADARNRLDEEAAYRQADIVYGCMEGRGWRVLG